MFYTQLTETPVGPILVAGDAVGLQHVAFGAGPAGTALLCPQPEWGLNERPLREAVRQLQAYFRGQLRAFDLPLAAQGTAFQQRVWQALLTIPYGMTRSYGQQAAAIGSPQASRAVGLANGRNPISIIIPCHRVIGANGSLTGYGGGMERKQLLLELEQGGRLIR